MRWFLRASCAIAAFSSTAMADGMPGSLKDAPPPVEHYNWSGVYFGVGGGFSNIDRSRNITTERTKEKCDDHDHKDKCNKTVTRETKTTHASAGDDDWNGFGTVQVGYDHTVHHHIVVGAFADFDLYDGDGSFHFADGHGHSDLDWAWHIGGRLGTLVSPHVLLFGTGGYTQAQFDGAVWITDGPTLHHDDTVDGWFIGGGAEMKLRKHVALKFEYRYADYDGNKASGSTTKTTDTTCGHLKCRDVDTVKSHSDMDLEVQSVRALVVFRLDEDREPIVPLK